MEPETSGQSTTLPVSGGTLEMAMTPYATRRLAAQTLIRICTTTFDTP